MPRSGSLSLRLSKVLLPIFGLALALAGAAPAAAQMLPDPSFGTIAGPSNSAILRCNGSDPVAAIAGCTAIIRSQPSRAQVRSAALINRGRAHYALGQKDRAIDDFDEAVRADPRNSRALANRGAFYQAQARSQPCARGLQQRGRRQSTGRRGAQSTRQPPHASR